MWMIDALERGLFLEPLVFSFGFVFCEELFGLLDGLGWIGWRCYLLYHTFALATTLLTSIRYLLGNSDIPYNTTYMLNTCESSNMIPGLEIRAWWAWKADADV
jgi:hypothetical protein